MLYSGLLHVTAYCLLTAHGHVGYFCVVSNTDQRKVVQVTILPSVHRVIKERAVQLGTAPGRVIEAAVLAAQAAEPVQPMHTAPRDGSQVHVRFGATLYRDCWFDAQIGRWRWGANADVLAAEPDGWVAW